MTDIVKAVQEGLQNAPAIQALVAPPYIGEDAAWDMGWIFDAKLRVTLENTQLCAIVVNYGGGWSPPNIHNTMRFPQVVVDIWADPTRNSDHSVKYDDARAKAFRVYEAVYKVMHTVNRSLPAGTSIHWGDERIVSSEALAEPDITPVSDGNGAYMLRARFGITY